MVGLEILRGKQLKEGGVTPEDWVNFSISLLCHGMFFMIQNLRFTLKRC
jgi:hypothetical protein